MAIQRPPRRSKQPMEAIRELLEEGRKPSLPLLVLPAFQQAEKVSDVAKGQQELFGT